MMGIVTYTALLVLTAPASGSARKAATTPPPQAKVKAKVKARVKARVKAKAKVKARAIAQLPARLEGWPIGWGLGERPHWLEYARGRRIWRLGVGLLSTGVSGLAVFLSLGLTATIGMPRGTMQNMYSGLTVGFGLIFGILTYVGGSLLVKGKRIRDRAVLDILRLRSRSGSVQAEVQVGLGSLHLGGRF